MSNRLALLLWIVSAVAPLALAQPPAPSPILPDALRWVRSADNPALQAAWVLGSASTPGPYLLRVQLAANGRIPPHTHPDARSSTVLAGTLYVGFGETFDDARVVAIPPGGVYVAPAQTPHFLWAKDGDVLYQETGVGPTGTAVVNRAR